MDLVRWVMEGFGDCPVLIFERYAEKLQLRCASLWEEDNVCRQAFLWVRNARRDFALYTSIVLMVAIGGMETST